MVGSRNGAANRRPSAAPPQGRAARRLPSSATPAVSISLSFGRRSDVSGVVYTPKWDVQVSKRRTTASLGRSRAGQSGLRAKSNGAAIISSQAAVRSGRSCMTVRSLQPMQLLHGLICKRPGVATMSKWAAARDTSWPNMTAWTATPTGKGDGHLRRKTGAAQKQGRAVRSTMTVKRPSLLKRKSSAGQQALIARQATITGKFFGHQPKRTGVVAPTAVAVLPTTPTTAATLTSCILGQNPRLCGAVSIVELDAEQNTNLTASPAMTTGRKVGPAQRWSTVVTNSGWVANATVTTMNTWRSFISPAVMITIALRDMTIGKRDGPKTNRASAVGSTNLDAPRAGVSIRCTSGTTGPVTGPGLVIMFGPPISPTTATTTARSSMIASPTMSTGR